MATTPIETKELELEEVQSSPITSQAEDLGEESNATVAHCDSDLEAQSQQQLDEQETIVSIYPSMRQDDGEAVSPSETIVRLEAASPAASQTSPADQIPRPTQSEQTSL